MKAQHRVPPVHRLLLVVLTAVAIVASGCTMSRPLPDVTSKSLPRALDSLEEAGWQVEVRTAKGRAIEPHQDGRWGVISATTDDDIVILTVGALTKKTRKIAYKSRTVKVKNRSASYRRVKTEGKAGKRTTVYIDGSPAYSKVTEKPVTQVIHVGTGVRTQKRSAIAYKTKILPVAWESTSYRKVVQEGRAGNRTNTYLDGRLITSKVTRKPVTRIVQVGTSRPYTGRCTIWGGYAKRYVECTGHYDPAARQSAQRLVDLCNSTSQPISDCRDIYGSYFD